MISFAFTIHNVLLHCFDLNAHLVITIVGSGYDQVALYHIALLVCHILHHLTNFGTWIVVILTIALLVVELELLTEKAFEEPQLHPSYHTCLGLF